MNAILPFILMLLAGPPPTGTIGGTVRYVGVVPPSQRITLTDGQVALHNVVVPWPRSCHDHKVIADSSVRGALTNACKVYFIRHQMFPKSLKILTRKDEYGAIYIDDPSKIIDPWGRPFQYDAAGTRNLGLQPDIWCVAPDGTLIGNWPKQPR